VLEQLPQDPFSELAASLMDTVKRPPTFERFQASETALNESMMTIKIDVFVNYQGGIRRAFSYIVPIN